MDTVIQFTSWIVEVQNVHNLICGILYSPCLYPVDRPTAYFNLKQEVLPVHVLILMFGVFSLFCTVTLTCYIFLYYLFFIQNFSLPIELNILFFLCTELKIIIGKIEDANNKFQSEVFFCGFDLPYTKRYKSS